MNIVSATLLLLLVGNICAGLLIVRDPKLVCLVGSISDSRDRLCSRTPKQCRQTCGYGPEEKDVNLEHIGDTVHNHGYYP